MYDAGEHVGVWGHSSRCKACDGRWEAADFRTTYAERLTRHRRPNRDDMIGRDVIARTARGFNVNGGGMFTAHDVRGQIWSEADPTVTGSRKGRAYWVADGQHFYAAAASELIDQCEAEWPSPVSGGMADARCVESPALVVEGMAFCAGCAEEVAS